MRKTTGECPECGYSVRLRADRTIGGHKGCPGAGKPPVPLRFIRGFPLCMECSDYLLKGGAMLAEATASVAIENGGNPGDMLIGLIRHYHEYGHEMNFDDV